MMHHLSRHSLTPIFLSHLRQRQALWVYNLSRCLQHSINPALGVTPSRRLGKREQAHEQRLGASGPAARMSWVKSPMTSAGRR